MSPAANKTIAVLLPLVTLPLAAFLLRWGAPGKQHIATMYGAAPGKSGQLAWQLRTEIVDRGVKETVPMNGVEVTVRGAFGERTWRGDSDRNGVAELRWDDLRVARGDALGVTAKIGAEVLASGNDVRVPSIGPAPSSSLIAMQDHGGGLSIAVAVSGSSLAAGFGVPIWVRVVDTASALPVSGASVTLAPEPGLEARRTQLTTCASGWAQTTGTAIMHAVQLSVKAEAGPEGAKKSGTWFGGLPVHPGASFVALPPVAPAGQPLTLEVNLVGPRDTEYLSIADESGRAFAATVSLITGSDGRRLGRAEVPGLAAGRYTVSTSGQPDPNGASEIDRPLDVMTDPNASADACTQGGELAVVHVEPAPLTLLVDGPSPADRAPAQHRRDLAKWGASTLLVLGALGESLLLLAAARRSRREALVAAIPGAEPPRKAWTTAVIAIVWIGFGVLLALIWTRG